jgi:hypothetical protein
MRGRWRLSALLLPLAAAAEPEPERTVMDLAYGEVLFAFYQDDHFTALTRLLAGLERNELPNHAHDADLMLGALYLSYGQHQIAGDVFAQVLEQSVEPALHDRAWFFLARIWHQRGYLVEAEAALGRISAALPVEFEPERIMLEAQILLAQQRFDAALAVLEAWQEPDAEWLGFARYNIGVALVRLGRIEAGAAVLAELGGWQQEMPGETELALRDKANVALGYALLQAAQPLAAKPILQRVRLEGPYSNKALLGVGWADAELGDYRAALAPWSALNGRDLLDAAVQESLLALPYAFSQLDADGQAADYYERAITAFTGEMGRIDAAIESVRRGELLADWLAAQGDAGQGWYFGLDRIPATDGSRYLSELMADHHYQEAVKNYRDLMLLDRNLADWSGSLGAFDDILATRQQAYAARLPLIESSINGIDLDALERERVALESRLATIEQTTDVVALGTPDQQRIWRELAAMQPALGRLAGEPAGAELAARQQFFRGLMLWDLERDYRARLWTEQRALRELDRELREARQRRHAVATRVEIWPEQFATLSARIDLLAPRVAALRQSTGTALAAQREFLERAAVETLLAQRERLDSYLIQARFALASIYDRAQARGEGPIAMLGEAP